MRSKTLEELEQEKIRLLQEKKRQKLELEVAALRKQVKKRGPITKAVKGIWDALGEA